MRGTVLRPSSRGWATLAGRGGFTPLREVDRGAVCKGRKRGLAVDVLGLVIAVIVLTASTHDNAAGIALLDQAAEHSGVEADPLK